MPYRQVIPVFDESVRKLCPESYPNHKDGCPNWNKRAICPPQAPLLGDTIDLSLAVWAVWNVFDFGGHVARMRKNHPDWSQRQLECCLYWQNTARKQLRGDISKLLSLLERGLVAQRLVTLICPEGCGVNVTATMASIGIALEWPPKTVTYQVALVGMPVEACFLELESERNFLQFRPVAE